MSYQIGCPSCGVQLQIDDHITTPAVRCPQCQAVVSLQSNSGTVGLSPSSFPKNSPRASGRPGGTRHSDPDFADSLPPPPQDYYLQEASSSATFLNVAKWLSLCLATAFTLGAVVLPVVGVKNVTVSFVLAGSGIGLGLLAMVFSAVSRDAPIGSAVAAVGMGVVALFFAINFTAAADKLAKERKAAEEALASAEDKLSQVDDAPARAEAVKKMAEAAEAKATKAIDQLKTEQQNLEKQRQQIAADVAKFAAEKAGAEEIKAKVDLHRQDMDKDNKALAERTKKVEADEAHANELMVKAAAKDLDADKKLKDAEAAHKKVKDIIDGVGIKLKAGDPEQRKAAITALGRIGPLAAMLDYDLCRVIADDPERDLRNAALFALKSVQPKLYPVAATFSLPIERSTVNACSLAIVELPTFGKAGIPFIRKQLRAEGPGIADLKSADLGTLLNAHIVALAKMAPAHDSCLELLVTLTDSPLAFRYDKVVSVDRLTQVVGKHLVAIATAKPDARKKIAQYCTRLVKSKLLENRLLGVNVLGILGPDAASSLPMLKQMQTDVAPRVREAVKDAIARIEQGRI